MKERKRAGHLLNVTLRVIPDEECVVALGFLAKDTRETHHTGAARDFSGSDIHTSYVERLEYVESTDTTIIFTRNSIYFAQGDLINKYLGIDQKYAEGAKEICDAVSEVLEELEEIEVQKKLDNIKRANDLPKFKLTEVGSTMTGIKDGSILVRVPHYDNHPFSGQDESAYTLAENYSVPHNTLGSVVFLKPEMVEEV